MTQRSTRATALAPDERRAAIVDATLQLVAQHGTSVTTRQIAEAAGIAEGTVFRAFADKESLMRAVIDAAYDPAPTEQAIAAIDPELPFETRLARAVAVMQQRLHLIWSVAGLAPPPPERVDAAKRGPQFSSLVAIFASERRRISRPPAQAAQLLRALTLAMTHPSLRPEPPLGPKAIVSVLLDGIRRAPSSPASGPRSSSSSTLPSTVPEEGIPC